MERHRTRLGELRVLQRRRVELGGSMRQTGFPIRLFTTVLVACVACVEPAAQPAGYRVEAVTFNHSAARVGNLELTLEEPDNPERPTMWEGPVRIRGTSGTCEATPSLITKVLID